MSWKALLACSLLLTAAFCLEEPGSQSETLEDLREQITALGKQIKAAESGKQQVQKLLDSGKSKQKAFETEIEVLKASILDSSKQEGALNEQLALLKDEAVKLRSDEALHTELRGKFQAVSEELEATKSTLAATLKQLADRAGQATAAEGNVAAAGRKLEKALKERDEAQKRLAELDSSAADASKLQKQLEAEQGAVKKLEVQLTAAKADAAELKTALKAAEKEASSWQSKAEKAARSVESAELKLEKALKDHTATQTALIQAEAKAQEAVQRMELLLTSWLPHWLEDRYQQMAQAVQPAVKRVQPTLETAWRQGKQVSEQGRAKALWAIGVSRAKTVAAWKTAKPTVDRAIVDSKVHLTTFSKQVSKASGPHLAGLRKRARKAFRVVKKQVAEVLSHPQVLKVRRKVQQTVRQAESFLIRHMKKVPQLKPYAKRPFVSYLIYAALAAPIITVLLPLMAPSGTSKKRVQQPTRKLSQRDDVPPEAPAKGNKSKKAARHHHSGH